MVIMKNGKVELYIHETLRTKGSFLFSLIDPVDYKSEKEAVQTASAVAKGGVDAILLGGSIGAQGVMLDNVAKSIQEATDIPLVLFPGNVATITRRADAIFFMSLLNSRNPYWHAQAQMLAAPLIKESKIEALPVGYILVYPGGTAGWVGDVNLIPREKPKLAAGLALTGQYLGNRFIFTDTGSNPKMQGQGHIPNEMIAAVKMTIDVPYIVGGGVTTTKELSEVYSSGADCVVIGTAFESGDAYKGALTFSKVAKEEGAKKLKKM